MKNICTAVVFALSISASAQDARALARQNEERAAANKAANEHINAAYTNNLPNNPGGGTSGNSSDQQVKANIESWWNRLQTDLKNVNNRSSDPNAYGMLSNEQRNEFVDTGGKRRKEVYYVNSIIKHYHENVNTWLDKIRTSKITCTSGDCQNGIGYGKIDNFNVSAVYKNGLLNGVIGFYVKDPLIKQFNLTYKDNVIDGQGTIDYLDGSFENLMFYNNTVGGESALILPTKESFFFNRNNGKISGTMKHYHVDGSTCNLIYREDELFTMLNANHNGFKYPSKLMYTGNFYIYIKEETMRKLFNDAGDGSFYAGEFKKNSDIPHGIGTKAWNDGINFTGKISEGSPAGEGILYFPDGGIYKGSLKNGNRTGKGEYYYADGDRYIGQFKNNYFHGDGSYKFSDGDQYVGNFKEGVRHGKGTYTKANGNVMTGTFKDGNGDKVKFYNNKNEEITLEQYESTSKG